MACLDSILIVRLDRSIRKKVTAHDLRAFKQEVNAS